MSFIFIFTTFSFLFISKIEFLICIQVQPPSYIPPTRDHYDSNYLSPYHHHEDDFTAFHHQLPFGIKRMNEQTPPTLGQMNKRMRHPPNGMHYEMNHGTPSMYGLPPTGPSAMTGNGMMV